MSIYFVGFQFNTARSSCQRDFHLIWQWSEIVLYEVSSLMQAIFNLLLSSAKFIYVTKVILVYSVTKNHMSASHTMQTTLL